VSQATVEAEASAAVAPDSTSPATTPAAARSWLPAALAAVTGLVVVGLLAVLWLGLELRQKGTVGESSAPLRTAPDFELGLFDGGTFRLAGELGRGRPVLVNFWASWCVPCAEEAPLLENASRRYQGAVTFVGVDVEDTDADARAFLQKYGISYPNGAGNAGPISVSYGMRGVPESYFVARDGRIVRKWDGALTTAALEQFLAEVQRSGSS
jgi:cytochrome c biogenesis protein CcmG, thiol:disulfide interchange protein DsbE